jgi:hypothetical protein
VLIQHADGRQEIVGPPPPMQIEHDPLDRVGELEPHQGR